MDFNIFFSVLILSLAWLYIHTKDQWSWKKIIKRIALFLLLSAALIGGGLWAYLWFDAQPKIQKTLDNITLGESKSDVIFKLGKPTFEDKKEDEENLSYLFKYKITLNQNKVHKIFFMCHDRCYSRLNGIGCNDTSKDIKNMYGNIESSDKFLENGEIIRSIKIKKYNVEYLLEKDKVTALIVSDFTKN